MTAGEMARALPPGGSSRGKIWRAARARVPWWGKVALKLVLARLPVPYRWWKRVRLFEHGKMEDPDYAYEVFERHYRACRPRAGGVGLELGPGDSVSGALLHRAFGGGSTWLVDTGDFAERDLGCYRRLAQRLLGQGRPLEASWDGFDAMMASCGGTYLQDGLRSLRTLLPASVDWAWSQAVLEHVPLEELDATLAELHRVLAPGARASHVVDFQDHLGGRLDQLRFPHRIWESSWMRSSGFYTNRVRLADLITRFQRAGFAVEACETTCWSALPTPRTRFAPEFRELPDQDLLVAGCRIVLRRNA